jgi:hypothetical protein
MGESKKICAEWHGLCQALCPQVFGEGKQNYRGNNNSPKGLGE